MPADELSENHTFTEAAALNNAEISALLRASSASSFKLSEKVMQAPLTFQKKTLAEVAQAAVDEALIAESIEPSKPHHELTKDTVYNSDQSEPSDHVVINNSQENQNDFLEPIDHAQQEPVIESPSDGAIVEALKARVEELEAKLLEAEAAFNHLKAEKDAAEQSKSRISDILKKIPLLAADEEEKFCLEVMSVVEDIVRQRIGNEISTHPEKFILKINQKITELYNKGSRAVITLNSEDFAAVKHILPKETVFENIEFATAEELGHGDVRIVMGSLHIDDKLQSVPVMPNSKNLIE